MQRILFSLVAIILLATAVAAAYGFYRTWRTSRNPDLARFLSGTAPAILSEGLWNGTAEELGEVSWKGKKFLPGNTGINIFETDGTREEKYRFTTYPHASLSDKSKTIMRIDYNRQGNPWWLKFIVDEVVDEGRGRLLGAVYVTVIPGVPFRMGYFRLVSE